jgi:hypothetical protein
MKAGSDGEAAMRAHIMIAALTALALFAVAHRASTQNRVIGTPDCTVDCSKYEAQADNGIGTRLPIDPNDYDDGDDN